jgi:putative phosphoesterase
MRIVVISDTHGHNKEIIEALSSTDRPDLLIHLGDHVEDGEKISKIFELPIIIVKGNGDYGSSYKEDALVELAGKKFFITHGHKYRVSRSLDNLYYRALELGADIVLFGHTHVHINLLHDNIIILNPGSPSFPRGMSRTKTFGLIEIGEKVEARILPIS